MSNELLKSIAQLRREIPRHPLVHLICDELQARLKPPRAKFDKVAYQRQYMRQRRLKEKQERK